LLGSLLSAGLFILVLGLPDAARANFELQPGAEGFSVNISNPDGTPDTLAGTHPFSLGLAITVKKPGDEIRDLHLALPPGLILNPGAVPACSTGDFSTPRQSPFGVSVSGENCPDRSQVGVVAFRYTTGGYRTFGMFRLEAQSGADVELGLSPYGEPILANGRISQSDQGFESSFDIANLPENREIDKFEFTLWGNPWLVQHDKLRGNCLNTANPENPFPHPEGPDQQPFEEARLEPEPQPDPANPTPYAPGTCSIGDPHQFPPTAYLTLPTSCSEMSFALTATSRQSETDSRTVQVPLGGCENLEFTAQPKVSLSNPRAASASGLDLDLDVDQKGLLDNVTPAGRLIEGVTAPSPLRRVSIDLPGGVTINPAAAGGLGVCTTAQFEAETASPPAAGGCPEGSRIGSFTVEPPIDMDDDLEDGAIFLAAPVDNPSQGMIGLYLVARAQARGLLIKLSAALHLDPKTGALTAVIDGLPKLPFSELRFHLGQDLFATPAKCGTPSTTVDLTTWREPPEDRHASTTTPVAAPDGATCTPGGTPFTPTVAVSSPSSQAGAYSPFDLRLTRTDDEQEITSYSATLPPGLLGKLAGVPYCPDAAIVAAESQTGGSEREGPSCPAASQIGRISVDYGIGSVTSDASGSLYVAGPYQGSQVSVLAIAPAVLGAFDLGVIVVRSPIRVDPLTAQVSVSFPGDAGSIPQIIDGVPLHLRDIRASIDRPEFLLDPTSCNTSTLVSKLTGSTPEAGGADPEAVETVGTQYSTANCDSLGFHPRFALRLRNVSRHVGSPGLRVELQPDSGGTNLRSVQVTLPPTLFLKLARISAICTQAQFTAEECPLASAIGKVVAVTPLLAEPMSGNAYLRASSHLLPEVVLDLHGQGFRVELSGRVSAGTDGGLRVTFPELPDVPVSKYVLTIPSGKHGILENSASLCASPRRARVRFMGQSHQRFAVRPPVRAKCAGGKPVKTH
jgi:hypothetical protein